METLRRLGPALLQAAKLMAPIAEGITLWNWVEKACEECGFLPHRSIPFGEFYRECGDDYGLFAARVSEYYKNHEKNILQSIESELMNSDIDTDRKETIQEAFKALECDITRLPVRALLPDIERTILEDWLGEPKGTTKTLKQKQIHMALEDITFADAVPNVIYDYRLFGRFAEVLYAYVFDPSKFQEKDIPNRHAALHGWVNYGTKEFCLNTLMLYAYIVRLTPILKKQK